MLTRYFDTTAIRLDKAFIQAPNLVQALSTPFPEVIESSTLPLLLKAVDGSAGDLEPWSGLAGYLVEFAVGPRNDAPEAGTFTVTGGGNADAGTPASAALAFNCTAEDFAAALASLTGIEPADVSVAKMGTGLFRVEFQGALAETAVSLLTFNTASLAPASLAYVSTVQPGGPGVNAVQLVRIRQRTLAYKNTWTLTDNGWAGEISFDNIVLREHLGDRDVIDDVFYTIRVTPPIGTPRVYALGQLKIGSAVLSDGETTPPDSPSYFTAAQSTARFPLYFPQLTGLTGGGPTNIDGLPTPELTLNSLLLFNHPVEGTQTWVIEINDDARPENAAAGTIIPDDANPVTNNLRWTKRS